MDNSAPTSRQPLPLLLAWDFNGVIDTYGSDLPALLQAVLDRGGQNIIVSNGNTATIHDYLARRQLADYINHVYGMDRHHGLVVRHKVAAITGHIDDQGPFAFVLMVGDNLSDMEDGRDAGAHTCLFDQHQQFRAADHAADYVVQDLAEVLDLLPV